jgi:hypothetical protein
MLPNKKESRDRAGGLSRSLGLGKLFAALTLFVFLIASYMFALRPRLLRWGATPAAAGDDLVAAFPQTAWYSRASSGRMVIKSPSDSMTYTRAAL